MPEELELGQYVEGDPRIGRRVKVRWNPSVLVITDVWRWPDGFEKFCTKLVGFNRGSGLVAPASMLEFLEGEYQP